MPLAKRLSARLSGSVTMHITYEEGRGVMSASCRLATDASGSSPTSPPTPPASTSARGTQE